VKWKKGKRKALFARCRSSASPRIFGQGKKKKEERKNHASLELSRATRGEGVEGKEGRDFIGTVASLDTESGETALNSSSVPEKREEKGLCQSRS